MINKIPKKIHYVWFWKWDKPKKFEIFLNSWKKYCPDYEIIEWNETNFDITKNKYCFELYNKKKWAFAADYARFDILYNHGGIYLDTDIEILKNLDIFLDNNSFFWYQDTKYINWAIIWAEINNNIIKEILNIYDNKKNRVILPNLLTKFFKKHIKFNYSNNIIKSENFTIYPKEYFYPYKYFEKPDNMIITKNTFTIHYYNATWLPKIVTWFIFPIIRYIDKNYNKYKK